MNKPWNWGALGSNPSVTPTFVENNMDKPWEWGAFGLSRNPSVTPTFVENNINKPWDWGKYALSNNQSVTTTFVGNNLDKPWDWGLDGLSNNKMTIHDDCVESYRRICKNNEIIKDELLSVVWHPDNLMWKHIAKEAGYC